MQRVNRGPCERHRCGQIKGTFTIQRVTATVQKLGRAVMAALRPDGLRVMQFNGATAGQTVFHYHVHLRPAYRDQDLRSHGRRAVERAEIEALAAKIRAAL